MTTDVQYIYVVEGLSDMNLSSEVPRQVRRAAMRAVNKATPKGRTAAGRAIRQDVNLPAGYLTGAAGRLQMSQAATTGNLERSITGRRRATSLARYAKGGSRAKGVRVMVKPGAARYIKRGFLMQLRAGNEGALGNLGLAVRTDGGAPAGAFKPKRISDNLWLVYGLSVDVMFRRVIGEITPGIQDDMEREFYRQLDLGAPG